MRLRLLSFFVFIASTANLAIAKDRTDTLQLLKVVLFDDQVYKKIFFLYDTDADVYHGVPPKGMCAFILPDTVFGKLYPNIGERLFNSWVDEHALLTTQLISNEQGTLYVSSNWLNKEIVRWVIFDKIFIQDNRVVIEFHTGSISGKIPESQQTFYAINCSLVKKGKKWVARHVKAKEVPNADFATFFDRVGGK